MQGLALRFGAQSVGFRVQRQRTILALTNTSLHESISTVPKP